MPTVIYLLGNGNERTCELEPGQTVMEGATSNGVPGILAECGGACMCATCHVYIETPDLPLPSMTADEDIMLDETAAERRSNSRLSCQIQMNETLNGLRVRVADNH